jgi:hypothetical protein
LSKLLLPAGDDHPEAAHKHLLDAKALLAESRPDGAAYLSGYVVECALKSLWLLEIGIPPGNKMPWGRQGHDLPYLLAQVAGLATVTAARTARYFGSRTRGLAASPLTNWSPEMRYRAPALAIMDAESFHDQASAVFSETIHQMKLDGVI